MSFEDNIWTTIHILCRTFSKIRKDDIKHLKCAIYNIFYLVPNQYKDYKRYAFIYLHTKPIEKVPKDRNNHNLIVWSIDFRNFLNRQIGAPEVSKSELLKEFKYTNLTKNVWGPPIWKVIHYLARIVDQTRDYINFKSFIICLQFLLPCMECREHFRAHLMIFPLDMAIRKNKVFEWSVNVHNEATKSIIQKKNKNRSKTQTLKVFKPFSLQEAIIMYEPVLI